MQPPLAFGGHAWVRFQGEVRARPATLLDPTPTPSLYRCVSCHLIVTGWQLDEGHYPKPCRALLHALPAPEED